MSYTNVELVRHHLELSFPVQSQVYDQAVILAGDGYVTFFGGAVDSDSVRVKSARETELVRKAITFNSSSEVISGSPLVPGSLLLASDSSLGTVYAEGRDYVVDYGTAGISIKSGGDIQPGQEVTVWYQQYFLYEAGTDYIVDLSGGAVKRGSSGDISDGETVYLDYTPLFASYKEELIANAVTEANGLVEHSVDPDRQFGADPALQGAATYRALEIICRASAARELSSQGRSDKAALAWIKLADWHGQRSEQLLSMLRPPLAGPASPTRS